MHVHEFILNVTSDQAEALRAFYRDVVCLERAPAVSEYAFKVGGGFLSIDGHSEVHGHCNELRVIRRPSSGASYAIADGESSDVLADLYYDASRRVAGWQACSESSAWSTRSVPINYRTGRGTSTI